MSPDHIACLVFHSAALVADVPALQRLSGCAAVTGGYGSIIMKGPSIAFDRLGIQQHSTLLKTHNEVSEGHAQLVGSSRCASVLVSFSMA